MEKQEFVTKYLEMQKQRKIQKKLEDNKELIKKKRNEYVSLKSYEMDKYFRLS